MNHNSTPVIPTSPWNFLLNPTVQLPPEAVYLPKRRGRPRKHVPSIGKSFSHRMDDISPLCKNALTHIEKIKLVKQFKLMLREGDMSLKESIEKIAFNFKMTYVQAHEQVKDIL